MAASLAHQMIALWWDVCATAEGFATFVTTTLHYVQLFSVYMQIWCEDRELGSVGVCFGLCVTPPQSCHAHVFCVHAWEKQKAGDGVNWDAPSLSLRRVETRCRITAIGSVGGCGWARGVILIGCGPLSGWSRGKILIGSGSVCGGEVLSLLWAAVAVSGGVTPGNGRRWEQGGRRDRGGRKRTV